MNISMLLGTQRYGASSFLITQSQHEERTVLVFIAPNEEASLSSTTASGGDNPVDNNLFYQMQGHVWYMTCLLSTANNLRRGSAIIISSGFREYTA